MKVYNESIEVTALFDSSGGIRPLRFKLQSSGPKDNVVTINRIQTNSTEKFCGKHRVRITCLVTINKAQKLCELHYYKEDSKWILFKM